MEMQTDSLLRMGSLALGPVVGVGKILSTPISGLTLTISFVGIPVVSLNVSLTSEETSLESVMEPFGSLMQRVAKFGLEHSD